MYNVYENFPVFWGTQIWSLIMATNADAEAYAFIRF